MQITRRSLVCLIVSLVLSLAIDIGVAVTASKTTDEGAHASYGMNVLHFKPDRRANGFYDSQMPISALNAVPLAIGSYLQARQLLPRTSKVLGDFKVARSATILATLLLNVLVFLWAYDLYGEWPAMASCLLCMLSPNLIANGTLTTTDMYCAVGMVGSLFVFHRFLLRPTMVNALFGGLARVSSDHQVFRPGSISRNLCDPGGGDAAAYNPSVFTTQTSFSVRRVCSFVVPRRNQPYLLL